ncbi:hypothetical protein KR067_007595 [Drosophila pandora]|nr:hypothetical protein KR067_007595 [Drosophila pandora]
MNTSLANVLIGEDSGNGGAHPGDLANDIIDDLLTRHPKEGHYEESYSWHEPSLARSRSKCSVDRRLEYWKNMLIQRRALQERLRSQTGRGPAQMLHNRPQGPEDFLEIVGVPQGTPASAPREKDEVRFSDLFQGFSDLDLGLDSCSFVSKTESLLLQQRSGSRVGMGESLSLKCVDASPDLCIRINGIAYKPGTPEFSPTVERTFTCHPFQRHVRMVVRIENSGRSLLHCCWQRVNFFSNNRTLLRDGSNNFLFDTQAFQLRTGESREVTMLYQPRTVSIVKMRWLLYTRPRIFFRRPYGLTLNIHGRCTPPKEYLERLMVEKTRARLLQVESSGSEDEEMDEEEKKGQSLICPYVREMEEREVFNILNRSYICHTYEDLERLHAIFEKMNKSSNCWDLSVQSLMHLVLTVPDLEARIQLSEDLTTLLNSLRNPSGPPLSISDSPRLLQKRGTSELFYVRGLLVSRLDEWEQLAIELEGKPIDRKYFIKSIYTLLYGTIGNTVEDIVSIIESMVESSEF